MTVKKQPIINKIYHSLLADIKAKITLAKQTAIQSVNTQLLVVYWEIGNAIIKQEATEGWGKKVIVNLARDLKLEFPEMSGLSERNLKYMKDFAAAYPFFITSLKEVKSTKKPINKGKNSILQAPLAKLSWYHHITLLDKIKDEEMRAFYIAKTAENNWSRNVMVYQIESNLYARQGKAITNFSNTLPKLQSDLANETLKNPYVFDFLNISEEISELNLERTMLQHLKKFMLEIGKGFAYVGNQYKLQVDEDEFFLDLLFYNIHLHCYVIFELKIGDFKPEYAGKLNFYINTIDNQIKGKLDKPTLGVLLCKTPNKTVIKYALQGIKTPIGVSNYKLEQILPKNLKSNLPSIKELEDELNKEYKEFSKTKNTSKNILKTKNKKSHKNQ